MTTSITDLKIVLAIVQTSLSILIAVTCTCYNCYENGVFSTSSTGKSPRSNSALSVVSGASSALVVSDCDLVTVFFCSKHTGFGGLSVTALNRA